MAFEGAQMLALSRNIKTAIINMFKGNHAYKIKGRYDNKDPSSRN